MDQIDMNNIKKNTTQMIAMELYRKDNKMRKNKKMKQLIIAFLCLLSITGITTADALTGGKISKRVTVLFTGENNEQEKIEGKVYTDKDGNIWVKYDKDGNQLDINESELEKNDLEVEVHQSQEESEITIK